MNFKKCSADQPVNGAFCSGQIFQNLNMVYMRISSTLQGTAFFAGIQDMVDDLLRDQLSGSQNRNARRIAHDRFTADAAG